MLVSLIRACTIVLWPVSWAFSTSSVSLSIAFTSSSSSSSTFVSFLRIGANISTNLSSLDSVIDVSSSSSSSSWAKNGAISCISLSDSLVTFSSLLILNVSSARKFFLIFWASWMICSALAKLSDSLSMSTMAPFCRSIISLILPVSCVISAVRARGSLSLTAEEVKLTSLRRSCVMSFSLMMARVINLSLARLWLTASFSSSKSSSLDCLRSSLSMMRSLMSEVSAWMNLARAGSALRADEVFSSVLSCSLSKMPAMLLSLARARSMITSVSPSDLILLSSLFSWLLIAERRALATTRFWSSSRFFTPSISSSTIAFIAWGSCRTLDLVLSFSSSKNDEILFSRAKAEIISFRVLVSFESLSLSLSLTVVDNDKISLISDDSERIRLAMEDCSWIKDLRSSNFFSSFKSSNFSLSSIIFLSLDLSFSIPLSSFSFSFFISCLKFFPEVWIIDCRVRFLSPICSTFLTRLRAFLMRAVIFFPPGELKSTFLVFLLFSLRGMSLTVLLSELSR